MDFVREEPRLKNTKK